MTETERVLVRREAEQIMDVINGIQWCDGQRVISEMDSINLQHIAARLYRMAKKG